MPQKEKMIILDKKLKKEIQKEVNKQMKAYWEAFWDNPETAIEFDKFMRTK